MGSIRVRSGKKGKTYTAQVRRHGYPQATETFTTRAAAERWVKTTEVRMDEGAYVNLRKSKDTTLLAALEDYEAKITPHKKTATKERSLIKTLKAEKIAQYSLSVLKKDDFSALRDEWLFSKVPPLKSGSVVRRLALLSHLYTVCREQWGHDGLNNPLLLVKKPVVEDARTRTVHVNDGLADDEDGDDETPRERAYVQDEIQHLLAATGSKILGPAIRFAVATAMRRGEIVGIRWKHVTIRANNRGKVFLPETKNGEARDVPLSPQAVTLLKSMMADKGGKIKKADRVFPITPDALTRAFGRALKRAREQYVERCEEHDESPSEEFLVGLRLHDLRHEAVTKISKHFEMQELAKITGHKSMAMLMRYYHPDADELAKKFPD